MSNLKKLLSISTESQEINTNNGWGFGGICGTRYEFNNNVVLIIGKASTRHRGSYHCISAYHNGTPIKGVHRVSRLNDNMIQIITETIKN